LTDQHEVGPGADVSSPTSWSIHLNNVSVTYPNGTTALRNVSLDIPAGEMVSIVGLSGSGKSTLIRVMNGLVPVTTGTVAVGPHEVTHLRGRQLRQLRGHIGMIFQGFNLAERTSVFRNVMVGRFADTPTYRTLLGVRPSGTGTWSSPVSIRWGCSTRSGLGRATSRVGRSSESPLPEPWLRGQA